MGSASKYEAEPQKQTAETIPTLLTGGTPTAPEAEKEPTPIANEVKEIMMRAEASSGAEVELDTHSEKACRVNVSFALLYPGSQASLEDLSTAFCKILPSFELLAGRLAKRSDKMFVLCNNAGVPLTLDKKAGAAPSFAEPISEDLFDMVRNHMPTSDEPGVTGDAPMRVKVTNFDDAQVLAVALNHGLCDACGIGLFMSAWAEAYRGGSGARQVSHDRILVNPPSPAPGSPPISKTEGVPNEWKALNGSDLPKMELEPLTPAMYFCMKKNPDICKALKVKCMQEKTTDVAFVSTNDAVTAEIIAAVDIEEDAENNDATSVGLAMVMDYRDCLGAKNVIGNMHTFLAFPVHHSLAAASDIRKALPVAQDKEFVKWLIGQGQRPPFTLDVKLVITSWTQAMKLGDLTFAGPVGDMMLGKPMLAERATLFGPRGTSYVVVLPMSNGGVKVAGVCSEATGKKLKDAGNEVIMTPV